MRIAGIQEESIVDGPGLRTTIFTQGCKHRCFNCHNPQTWDFTSGKEYTPQELIDELKKIPIIHKVTLSGGDPLYQNMNELTDLLRLLKENEYDDLILYTGFTFEEVLPIFGCEIAEEQSPEVLRTKTPKFDVLGPWHNVVFITDPYVEQLKSYETKFRGSSNQRVFRFLYGVDRYIYWKEITHFPEWK